MDKAKKHRVRVTWDMIVNVLILTACLAVSFIIFVAVWLPVAQEGRISDGVTVRSTTFGS